MLEQEAISLKNIDTHAMFSKNNALLDENSLVWDRSSPQWKFYLNPCLEPRLVVTKSRMKRVTLRSVLAPLANKPERFKVWPPGLNQDNLFCDLCGSIHHAGYICPRRVYTLKELQLVAKCDIVLFHFLPIIVKKFSRLRRNILGSKRESMLAFKASFTTRKSIFWKELKKFSLKEFSFEFSRETLFTSDFSTLRHHIDAWVALGIDLPRAQRIAFGVKCDFTVPPPQMEVINPTSERDMDKIRELTMPAIELGILEVVPRWSLHCVMPTFVAHSSSKDRKIWNGVPLNSRVLSEPFSLPSARSFLHLLEPGSIMCTLDFSNAYPQVAVAACDRKFLGESFKVGDSCVYLQHTGLPFGKSDAPWIANWLVEPVTSILGEFILQVRFYDDTAFSLSSPSEENSPGGP